MKHVDGMVSGVAEYRARVGDTEFRKAPSEALIHGIILNLSLLLRSNSLKM